MPRHPRSVGETQNTVGLGDIDVMRLWAGRVEGDAERLVEAMGEGLDRSGMRRAIGGTHHADQSGRGLGQEHVAVRRDPQDPRVVESVGEQVDPKPRRCRGNPVGGAIHDARGIAGRAGRERRRQVGLGDAVADAGRVTTPIPEGLAAGQHRPMVGIVVSRNCRRGRDRWGGRFGRLEGPKIGDEVAPRLGVRHLDRHRRAGHGHAGIREIAIEVIVVPDQA